MAAKDKSERCGSSSGDAALERQPSLLSLAPSETSRSDLTTRQGRDPEKSFVIQSKNYYKQVSENKEISKLTSLLSTAINSTKKVRTQVLKVAQCYFCFSFNTTSKSLS